MKFMESDMASYAEGFDLETAPGGVWNYNDGNFIVLSHLIPAMRPAAMRPTCCVSRGRNCSIRWACAT